MDSDNGFTDLDRTRMLSGKRKYHTPEGTELYIDENLTNAWMDALNSLRALKMTSNCEGHFELAGTGKFPVAGKECFPFVLLEIKEEFRHPDFIIPVCFRAIFQLIQSKSPSSSALVCGYSESELINHHLGANRINQKKFAQIVRINSTTARTKKASETSLVSWFEEIIPVCQSIDKLF